MRKSVEAMVVRGRIKAQSEESHREAMEFFLGAVHLSPNHAGVMHPCVICTEGSSAGSPLGGAETPTERIGALSGTWDKVREIDVLHGRLDRGDEGALSGGIASGPLED